MAFADQRQAIINGLDAASSPAFGWNDEVRDKEVVGAVVRTSNTVVTITLTAASAYSILGDETVTVTVPAAALTGAAALTAAPTFTVTDLTVQPYYVRTGGVPGMRIGRPGTLFGRSW